MAACPMRLCVSPPRRYIIYDLRWWWLDCLRGSSSGAFQGFSGMCSPPAQHPLSLHAPELPVRGDGGLLVGQGHLWLLLDPQPPPLLRAQAVYKVGWGAGPCLFLSLGGFSQCQHKAAVGEFQSEAVLGAGRAQWCFSTLVTCRMPSCISLFNI